MEETRKIGDYSVKYSMYIGHKDIALGENPNADKDERYMCCFVETNAIFERYSGVLVSDDFAEIAKVFGQRVADAAEEIIQENERACQEVGMNEELTTNSCKPISYEDSIENKVVVVKGGILRPEFRHANHQLMLCTGGFGAQANAPLQHLPVIGRQGQRVEVGDILGPLLVQRRIDGDLALVFFHDVAVRGHRFLLLVVGGLSRPDERNAARQAAKLLSQPLSSVNPPVFRNGVSLTANHGRPEGFFLESGRQSLLLLPDDPGAVEALFDRQVTELLQKKYGLSLAGVQLEQKKDPQRRARELQEEIKRSEEAAGAAARPASETAFGAAPGKPSAKKGKNSKKALPAFLLLLVLALALLAGLLLTHRLPEAEAWLRGSFPGLNW